MRSRFWLPPALFLPASGSQGRRDGALSARACLTGHAGHTWASTGNRIPKPHANPNNETVGWRARSTALKTWGGLRVVAVRVSGDAGLRIKRQTYHSVGGREQRREVEVLSRPASDRPHNRPGHSGDRTYSATFRMRYPSIVYAHRHVVEIVHEAPLEVAEMDGRSATIASASCCLLGPQACERAFVGSSRCCSH
jgi:hypothetical protein